MKAVIVIVSLILAFVAMVGVIVSWFKGHDHSAIGWMIIQAWATSFLIRASLSISRERRTRLF